MNRRPNYSLAFPITQVLLVVLVVFGYKICYSLHSQPLSVISLLAQQAVPTSVLIKMVRRHSAPGRFDITYLVQLI